MLRSMDLLERREFVAREFGVDWSKLATSDNLEMVGKIENPIGLMPLPLGLVGPMRVQFPEAKMAEFYVPLVTNEACLLASVNRGAKLTGEFGVELVIEYVGVNRAPVFKCASPIAASQNAKFIEGKFAEIKEIFEQNSKHTKLISVTTKVTEQFLHVMFYADTDEAMGMNMVTIAAKRVIDQFILEKCPLAISLVAESGNFCSDKKASLVNVANGRGYKVKAVTKLADWQMAELEVTQESLLDIYQAKLCLGSELAQAIGKNCHQANMLAAFYAATGQDLAHVVDGATGSTEVSIAGKDVVFSVDLPCLLVGSIGGGLNLPQVKEVLKIMKIKPGVAGEAAKLAGLAAATVLCGEVSLLLALAQARLASSHEKARA